MAKAARTEAVRVPEHCDGSQLQQVTATAAAWLQAHAHEVDALNVYPVPDGDTGSNMSQTMRAALAEAGAGDVHAGHYAAALAHGALMGARGNSGVILSQLLRGFARALAEHRTFTPADLAAALQEASATAYRAVMKPVEGTVLTVARVAAEAGVVAAAERAEFVHVLSSAVSEGRRALAETRNQLPALRQAGVVDAGGRGYMLLLEGALRHLQGRRAAPMPDPEPSSAASRAAAPVHARLEHTMESRYGYCTEFLISGADLSVEDVRETLAAFGDSLLVVGDPETLRVHVHTDDPGRALSYAGSLGRLRKVKVEDMQAQHDLFAGETPHSAFADETQQGAPSASGAAHAGAGSEALPVGVVAVAAGEGFAQLFASLGARVVPGGQTMNPSTEQILTAIGECRQQTVIVLPNNKNVVATAGQAAQLSTKTVHVLDTETVPQGIAALLAIRYDEETEHSLGAMREAARHVRTAELTTAVRDADLEGLQVRQGDILGLLDGHLALAGRDVGAVVTELLDRLPADQYEILTVYSGADVSAAECDALIDVLRRRYPELQIEQVAGGQPHYQFVLSAE
jgi:DAK2 domain fusion protein YloV